MNINIKIISSEGRTVSLVKDSSSCALHYVSSYARYTRKIAMLLSILFDDTFNVALEVIDANASSLGAYSVCQEEYVSPSDPQELSSWNESKVIVKSPTYGQKDVWSLTGFTYPQVETLKTMFQTIYDSML